MASPMNTTSTLASREQLVIKLNFAEFIRRFERENINVLEFGENIEYPKKIQAISDRLKEYARESINNQTTN